MNNTRLTFVERRWRSRSERGISYVQCGWVRCSRMPTPSDLVHVLITNSALFIVFIIHIFIAHQMCRCLEHSGTRTAHSYFPPIPELLPPKPTLDFPTNSSLICWIDSDFSFSPSHLIKITRRKALVQPTNSWNASSSFLIARYFRSLSYEKKMGGKKNGSSLPSYPEGPRRKFSIRVKKNFLLEQLMQQLSYCASYLNIRKIRCPSQETRSVSQSKQACYPVQPNLAPQCTYIICIY